MIRRPPRSQRHDHLLPYTTLFRSIRGYVFKDGQMSRIATVAADVAYDDQFWQTGYTADIVDEAGRATRIETDVFGCYTLKPVPNCSLNESGGRSMIDGKEGVGWMECCRSEEHTSELQSLMRISY